MTFSNDHPARWWRDSYELAGLGRPGFLGLARREGFIRRTVHGTPTLAGVGGGPYTQDAARRRMASRIEGVNVPWRAAPPRRMEEPLAGSNRSRAGKLRLLAIPLRAALPGLR